MIATDKAGGQADRHAPMLCYAPLQAKKTTCPAWWKLSQPLWSARYSEDLALWQTPVQVAACVPSPHSVSVNLIVGSILRISSLPESSPLSRKGTRSMDYRRQLGKPNQIYLSRGNRTTANSTVYVSSYHTCIAQTHGQKRDTCHLRLKTICCCNAQKIATYCYSRKQTPRLHCYCKRYKLQQRRTLVS